MGEGGMVRVRVGGRRRVREGEGGLRVRVLKMGRDSRGFSW